MKRLPCNQTNMRKWIKRLRYGDLTQVTGTLAGWTALRDPGLNVPMAQAFDDLLLEGPPDVGFCCLGVASEEYISCGHDLLVTITDVGMVRYGGHVESGQLVQASGGMLPDEVGAWLGLEASYYDLTDPDGRSQTLFLAPSDPIVGWSRETNDVPYYPVEASGANDNLNWSFEQIADSLEEIYLPPSRWDRKFVRS